MNGAVEEIQKTAPFIKDSSFVLLLSQLVVDILELNGFGIEVVRHPAYPVGKYSLKGNRLLSRLRHTGVFFRPVNNSLNFFLLFPVQISGNVYFLYLLFLFEKQ